MGRKETEREREGKRKIEGEEKRGTEGRGKERIEGEEERDKGIESVVKYM